MEVNLNVQHANKTSPFPYKFQILVRHNTALKRAAYCVLNCIRGSMFLPHGEQIVSLLPRVVVPDIKWSYRWFLWETWNPVNLGTIDGQNAESFHAK